MRNDHHGNMLWSGDGIELFIGHDQLNQTGPLLFSDRQILLGAGKMAARAAHFINSPKQYD